MNARNTRKIDPVEFERLYYQENATIDDICKFFNVTVPSIGSFRERHGYKARKRTHRHRKYPDRWQCQNCGDSFPNKDGIPRKFCSHKCYATSMKGTNPAGSFLDGKKHWNYTGVRLNRTYNHLVFTYSDKKAIAEKCGYSCSLCDIKFEKLPIYKLGKDVRFDHTVALGLGGEHSIENGQMLCIPCEKAKNSTDFKAIFKKNHK